MRKCLMFIVRSSLFIVRGSSIIAVRVVCQLTL